MNEPMPKIFPAKRGTGKTRELVKSLPAGRKIVVIVPNLGFWFGYMRPMLQNLRPDIQTGDITAYSPHKAHEMPQKLAGMRKSDIFFDHAWATKVSREQTMDMLDAVNALAD